MGFNAIGQTQKTLILILDDSKTENKDHLFLGLLGLGIIMMFGFVIWRKGRD